MNTKQLHLYHLRKHIRANRLIKPLMYSVHLLFLKLRPCLKYYGYSEIHFLKKAESEKKIRIYSDTKHFHILKCVLTNPSCDIYTIITKDDVKKGRSYFDIHMKELNEKGIYRLIIFFYNENDENKVEGIYISNVLKNLNKKKNSLISKNNKNIKDGITTSHNNCYHLCFQNAEKKTLNFDFKKMKFEDKHTYTYINTFCEFFFLPSIFPCIQSTIHRVKFKLKLSFEIKSNYIKKKKKKRDNFSFFMPYVNLHLRGTKWSCRSNVKKGKEKYEDEREFYKGEKRKRMKRSAVKHLRPSNLVVSNTKLKGVYHSKCNECFTCFLLCSCFGYVQRPEYGHRLEEHTCIKSNYARRKRTKGGKCRKELCNKITNQVKKEKEYITFEFYTTSKIANYTFCLFIGIYHKIEFKIKGFPIFIYIENYRKNEMSKYSYFTKILGKILLMFMNISIFRKKLLQNTFLQCILLNKYKYAGEENYNCVTFLISFIQINEENENDNLDKLFLQVKLIVHEIFHTLWGNCLYFRKEKYLWCKEGLTRYYELKYTKYILKKLKNRKHIKLTVYIFITLEYYFYVLTTDVLNAYNHALNIDSNLYKLHDCPRVISRKGGSPTATATLENLRVRDVHHFYNILTYNKGMYVFKIISIVSRPHFDTIMNLLYFTFYNRSINWSKIVTLFHFFFQLFRIKPFFLNCHKYRKIAEQVIKFIKKKKKFFTRSLVKLIRVKSACKRKWINYTKKKKAHRKNKNFASTYNSVIIPLFWSNFLKPSFKKYFLTYYRKIHRRYRALGGVTIYKGKINKRWKKSQKNEKCPNSRTNARNEKSLDNFARVNVQSITKKAKVAYVKKNNLKNILENYINIVGPPKIFFKFLKKRNKLLITQRHFYYDNYEQEFKETNILFQIPITFTFNKRIYKILLTNKFILLNVEIKRGIYPHKGKEKQVITSGNIFTISLKNISYFSYHFVDMFSFKFIVNAIKKNKCCKFDIIHIIVNIILYLLVRVKTLQHARNLTLLICRQLFLVSHPHVSVEIFISRLIKIENRKLKIELEKELRKSDHFDEMHIKCSFLLKDFRIYLSKIFFYFKESASTLS
ncbi:M1-family alanyl aminopeptidase, putative [Plasmodium malariae]|uniref:M1-family alanyl aminopeptidase, putative n=1 Tax=Plasmodium malariae TaxID=5858 RepID=A0A1C3L120_PLAMA|nr:M1-family alanyl aminopeptidase, putative [Plasmodium malariae]